MEDERFSSFACSLLTKRPRLSAQQQNLQESRDPNNGEHSNNSNLLKTNEPTDEQLLSWQERQIAKCIVDNTVNRVVESYLAFFDDDNDNGDILTAADVFPVEFDQPVNRNPLEESAILWAIGEHGLQQHNNAMLYESSSSSSSSATSTSSSSSSSSSSSVNMCFDLKEDFPNDIADNLIANDSENKTNLHTSSTESSTSGSSNSNCEEASASTSNTITEKPYADASENIDFDFMEAAVSVAIQKKGLTSNAVQTTPNSSWPLS